MATKTIIQIPIAIVFGIISAVFKKITKIIKIIAPRDCIKNGVCADLTFFFLRRFLPLFATGAMIVSRLRTVDSV